MSMNPSLNVLGGPLEPCSRNPLTGFFRNGCCDTGPEDLASHTVCTQVTAEFLELSREQGNDLSMPRPELGFRGLKPGDRWCVCAGRWKDALDAGVVAPVVLEATHVNALDIVPLEDLRNNAVDRARRPE